MPLNNQGLVVVSGGTSTLNGAVTTDASGTIRVRGGPGAATLTNGFTNEGAIDLTSAGASVAVTLTVSSGTLTNAAGASITSGVGDGGSRTLNAQLNNQGTLTVNHPLSVNKASAAHTNSGAIDVAGGDLRVTQSGSPATFSNTGTVAIAGGRTLNISGGSLANFSAGTLAGGTYLVAGTFRFPNAAVTTNATTVVLDGPASAIVNQSSVNALTNFAANAAAGSFTIQNGRNITTPAFGNGGNVTTGTGSGFLTSAGNYMQTGGATTVLGILDPAGIVDIVAGVLDGTGAINSNATNAGRVNRAPRRAF